MNAIGPGLGHSHFSMTSVCLFFQDVDTAKAFQEQASALYERATSGILNKSMLLHFAYADFEEQNLKFDKVHQVYNKFLDISDIDPTLVSKKRAAFTDKLS